MLNQVVLVGRLYEINKIGDKQVLITLATPRPYKNENGEYDTDYIPITLWEGIAQNTLEYCKKEDLVGIKGRIKMIKNENGYDIEIVAEKLTFLSSKKEDENNE